DPPELTLELHIDLLGGGQLLLREETGLDPLGELDLLLRVEEGHLADLLEVVLDRVGGGAGGDDLLGGGVGLVVLADREAGLLVGLALGLLLLDGGLVEELVLALLGLLRRRRRRVGRGALRSGLLRGCLLRRGHLLRRGGGGGSGGLRRGRLRGGALLRRRLLRGGLLRRRLLGGGLLGGGLLRRLRRLGRLLRGGLARRLLRGCGLWHLNLDSLVVERPQDDLCPAGADLRLAECGLPLVAGHCSCGVSLAHQLLERRVRELLGEGALRPVGPWGHSSHQQPFVTVDSAGALPSRSRLARTPCAGLVPHYKTSSRVVVSAGCTEAR